MWGMSLTECQRLHLVSTRRLKRSGALPHPGRPGAPRRGVSWRERDVSLEVGTAFSRAAVEFDVHESDFLILTMDRISTFEAMAFRFPKEADFEDYLKRAVRPRGAYRDEDDNVVGYDKRTPEPWDLYKSSEDCGCLRKLWHMAAQVAKKELESLASGQDESSTPKMNSVLSNELETKAVDSGMPTPASDKERPSLHTLGKVQANFSQGGQFQHLSWESFVDAELESRLKRSGKLPRDRTELVFKDDKVSLRNKEAELQSAVEIRDTASLREALEIRARAFHMLSVADYFVMRRLTEKYISMLRQTVIEGMRGPTMNEVRRTDRVLFEEILKWVSKGQGTVDAGVNHYLSEPRDVMWTLCSQQPENYPDQGIEKGHLDSTRKRKLADETEKKAAVHRDDDKSPDPPKGRQLRLCLVCGKRHEPLCKLPENFRKEQRRKAKENKAAAKAGRAEKDKETYKKGAR